METEPDSSDIDIEELERDRVPFSVPLSAVARFLLPVALLLLSANYILETIGRIRWSNLHYPYFVIGVLCVMILLVLVEEVRELRAMDPDVETGEAFWEYIDRWRISIAFAVIAVLYVALIPVIGFFSASLGTLIASMYVAGVRNYKISAIVILVVLGLVWLMFVELVGINPPRGIIDDLVF